MTYDSAEIAGSAAITECDDKQVKRDRQCRAPIGIGAKLFWGRGFVPRLQLAANVKSELV